MRRSIASFIVTIRDLSLGAISRVESLSYLPEYAFQLHQAIHLSGQVPPNQPADTEGDGSCSQAKQHLPHT